MEVVVNELAKEKMEDRNLKNKYIKLYYCGFGWTAGLQMEFDEDIDEKYKVYEVDGYKIGIDKDILDDYDYIEIKYSDNFIQKGFYPSILRPEEVWNIF